MTVYVAWNILNIKRVANFILTFYLLTKRVRSNVIKTDLEKGKEHKYNRGMPDT